MVQPMFSRVTHACHQSGRVRSDTRPPPSSLPFLPSMNLCLGFGHRYRLAPSDLTNAVASSVCACNLSRCACASRTRCCLRRKTRCLALAFNMRSRTSAGRSSRCFASVIASLNLSAALCTLRMLICPIPHSGSSPRCCSRQADMLCSHCIPPH